MMGTLQPLVLENAHLETFMQYLLDHHGPRSMLIVCSSKEAFLQQLQTAISDSAKDDEAGEAGSEADVGLQSAATELVLARLRTHRWMTPTLRLLASAQTLKLAFCEDVTHLRAFLAANASQPALALEGHDARPMPHLPSSPRLLAILSPIALHRPTSNFSAQGLNRTFSIAINAAHASRSKLVVAECSGSTPREAEVPQATSTEETEIVPVDEQRSVWEEEVSILNVTTKTFGASERGWVGRTVTLRAIASRWCVFKREDRAGVE